MTLSFALVLLLFFPFFRALALVPFSPGYSPRAGHEATKNKGIHGVETRNAVDDVTQNVGNDPHHGYGRRQFLLSIPSVLLVPKQAPAVVSRKVAGDAIIIGSGLAGLVSALTILDRGGRVVILEKEKTLGGNSKKASSGINGLSKYAPPGDSVHLFEQDTYKSHNKPSKHARKLINTLVENSEAGLKWLESRLNVDITQVAQLGGHSHPRTHRPKRGMIGAGLMLALLDKLQEYQEKGSATILTGSKAESLITESGAVVGVQFGRQETVYAPRTIMAAGGFAASKELLKLYCPDLADLPTTSGGYCTGDGILLATNVGAGLEDMSKVQVHPTGFVDPVDPECQSKTLAAEVLRGLGGILLDKQGRRFCNELGTRKYVSERMLDMGDGPFYLVLSSSAQQAASKHVDWYEAKGLMQTLTGIGALAEWMKVRKDVIEETLRSYEKSSRSKMDGFGKSVFVNAPDSDLENETFSVGRVTPVLHYCMGGLAMNARGQVLNQNKRPIPGLFAAGEVTGGLHGDNRLGGNSLLECTVFGRLIGAHTPITSTVGAIDEIGFTNTDKTDKEAPSRDGEVPNTKTFTLSELQKHKTAKDCWVAIDGRVFDLTDYAEMHPGGSYMIQQLAGKDGSQIFGAVHDLGILDSRQVQRYQVGVLEPESLKRLKSAARN